LLRPRFHFQVVRIIFNTGEPLFVWHANVQVHGVRYITAFVKSSQHRNEFEGGRTRKGDFVNVVKGKIPIEVGVVMTRFRHRTCIPID